MTRPFWLVVSLVVSLAVLACVGPSDATTGLALTRGGMDAIKVMVAAAGASVLVWELRRRRSIEDPGKRQRRTHIVLVLGLFAALCWWDLLHFHFRSYLHWWEFQHYYIAAKYFPELGYTRLYACTTVADAEDGHLDDARNRLIRDLSSNGFVRGSVILADPERCTGHFTEARWRMFKRDVGWFRALAPPKLWTRAQADFGYNGTPAWLILGRALSHTGPASSLQIWLLSMVDPVLLVAMWVLTWWLFGGPMTAVAMIWWGTNEPAFFGWTGGAFLRQDWLFALVLGVGLLYRRRWTAAGFALTCAAALRIFPVFALLALALKALVRMYRERQVSVAPEYRRVAVGCALAVAVIVPTSLVTANDWHVWSEFARDIRKHASSFTGNMTGLKAVMAYDHDTSVARTASLEREDDPFRVWIEFRERTLAERRFLHVVLALALSLVVLLAAVRQPDWVVAVLGMGLTPVLTSVSSYYFAFFLLFGLVGWLRPAVGIALCGLSIGTQAVPFFVQYFDDRYTATSVLILAFVVLASVILIWRPVREARAPAPPAP